MVDESNSNATTTTTTLASVEKKASPPSELQESDMMKKQEFTKIIDSILTNPQSGQIPAAANWLRAHHEISLWAQIKLKKSVVRKSGSGKVYILYILHEFLKRCHPDDTLLFQHWWSTVDEIINGLVRNNAGDDVRRKLTKTLARWRERKIYLKYLDDWEKIITGEAQPKRGGPPRLPKDVEGSISSFKCVRTLSDQPLLMDQDAGSHDVEHWRLTATSFIGLMVEILELPPPVQITALYFFHRTFDRGIYAQERFRVAGACILIASKSLNVRLTLFQVIRATYCLFEKHLLEGDEETEEFERLYLLHYERLVLTAVDFEITVITPLPSLEAFLKKHEELSNTLSPMTDQINSVLLDFFCLSICKCYSPKQLAQAAVYCICEKNGVEFDVANLCYDDDPPRLRLEDARNIASAHEKLVQWRNNQTQRFMFRSKGAGLPESTTAHLLNSMSEMMHFPESERTTCNSTVIMYHHRCKAVPDKTFERQSSRDHRSSHHRSHHHYGSSSSNRNSSRKNYRGKDRSHHHHGSSSSSRHHRSRSREKYRHRKDDVGSNRDDRRGRRSRSSSSPDDRSSRRRREKKSRKKGRKRSRRDNDNDDHHQYKSRKR